MDSLTRFALLLLQIILFSFVYLALDDNHFSGINKLEEMIKDEILQKKITPILKEKYQNSKTTEKELQKEIKEIIKDEDEAIDEAVSIDLKPTLFQSFFKRLYFSFVTGTTLGYGDIFPFTMICKTITIIQLITSIIIIVL
tara:strand:+ start:25423 stop:25845 length:423 start_codon:yes stop_codon:yes gene_type:complete